MIEIALYFAIYRMGGRRDSYKRTMKLPGIPRIGDRIELTDGGWSEAVRDVWWTYEGTVLIEFSPHGDKEFCEGSLNIAYVSEEDLASLERAGWEKI